MATIDSIRGKELPFDFLEKITDDFSEERELGTGPLRTTVYKAVLEDGEIAVKRHVGNAPGTRNKEAYRTNVHSIMKHRHENVVELLAFCLEEQYDALVWVGNRYVTKDIVVESLFCYEYFPNGSLHHSLFVEKVNIDWNCCGCFHWEKISATTQAKRGPAGPISAAHSPAGAAHILAGPGGRREAAHNDLRKLIFEL